MLTQAIPCPQCDSTALAPMIVVGGEVTALKCGGCGIPFEGKMTSDRPIEYVVITAEFKVPSD